MDQDGALISVLEAAIIQTDALRAAQRVAEAMRLHDEFKQSFQLMYVGGLLSINPEIQGPNLLVVAKERGAKESLNWYRKILNSIHIGIRIWAKIDGLILSNIINMSNGVKIIPFRYNPNSYRVRAIYNVRNSNSLGFELSAFAMLEIGSNRVGDINESQSIFNIKREIMKETIEAFCLDGVSGPTVIASWTEFEDPDFEYAQFGIQTMMNDTEGPAPRWCGNSLEQTLPWVEAYLHLPAETRAFFRLPIKRLNMALRNFTPGSKAIDGTICLDSICGKENDSNHIGHCLAVRSAKFLGRSKQEKDAIYFDLKEFYELRNETVHPTKKKTITDPESVAKRGLEICVQLVRDLILRGKKPEVDKWGTQLHGAPWDSSRWQPPAKRSDRPLIVKKV